MGDSAHWLNVTLDPERSSSSAAIEVADPDARNVVVVLDGIPGSYEHARLGLECAREGETIALDEL